MSCGDMGIHLAPIGFVESAAAGDRWTRISSIRICPEYVGGLRGLEEYSHAFIIYAFHGRRWDGVLTSSPSVARGLELGVFATRTPNRPNPIGLSVVELASVDLRSGVLMVKGLDADDGSPVLDLKPYDHWDSVSNPRVPRWWLEGVSGWPGWSRRP